MTRRTVEVTISGDAMKRDSGKLFIITEMEADRGERWAARALRSLARSGVNIPPELISAGMAGFAAMSWDQGMNFITGATRALLAMEEGDFTFLMEEMMSCVQRGEAKAVGGARPLVSEDIEEVATRVFLRGEVLS